MENKMTLNQEDIKQLRNFTGETQEVFAGNMGISIDTLRKWEQGKSKPSRMALEKLQKLVNQLKKRQLNGAEASGK